MPAIRLTRRRVLITTAAVAAVGAGATATATAHAAADRMSLGYYPGWVPYGPKDVDYTPWTHIAHFGIYPTSDGELEYGDLTPEDLPAAVEAAHAADTKIILTIGSEGFGEQFNGAASDDNRERFISEIVDVSSKHGYDGVDVDWEEDIDAAKFTALISELRAALPEAMTLSIAAVSSLLTPSLAAEVASHLEWVGLMSYWSDGKDEWKAYTDAGIAPDKLLIGIGLDKQNYADKTPELVEAKTALATDNEAAGVLSWSFQHLDGDFDDPRLEPLRAFVNG